MTETEQIDDYIDAHISAEDEYLSRLSRQTNLHLLNPRMSSGHAQGQLLKMIVEMVRPRRVLEIGTYTGYSAMSMARGLADGAILYTFERNDELEDFTRPWIEHSPWADKIRFIVGDVLADLESLARRESLLFDLVFIDGDKRQYCDYYSLAKRWLSPRGYILADNTLWYGHVVDSAYAHDAQTRGICMFNDMVAADPDAEVAMLPLRDGLTLIRCR